MRENNNKLKKILSCGLKPVALVGLLLLALAINVQVKAATFQIEDVGTIHLDSLVQNTNQDNDLVQTKASGNGTSNYVGTVSGQIDGTKIKTGDQITIRIASGGSGTFSSSINGIDPDVNDTNKNLQFNASVSGSTITLTKTSASLTGQMYYSLGFNVATHLQNYDATSSTIYIDGNLVLTYTNPALPAAVARYDSINLYAPPRANSSGASIGAALYDTYTELLNNGTLDKNEAKYTDDYIVMETITANEGSDVIGVTCTGNNIYTEKKDLMNGDTNLNNYSYWSGGNAPATLTDLNVELPDGVTLDQLKNLLAVGQCGVGENADGSWTVAVNYGPLIGLKAPAFPGTANISDSASQSGKTDTANQTLIDNARDMNLAAELFRAPIRVDFADPTKDESATVDLISTLSNDTDFQARQETIKDKTVDNKAEGQTTIKVHYVTNEGANLAEIGVSYGFPKDNALGVPATDPLDLSTVVPSDTGITVKGNTLTKGGVSYTLLTNATTAANAYDANVKSSPITAADVKTAFSGTVNYPSTDVTDVYYVYAKTDKMISGTVFDDINYDSQMNDDQYMSDVTVQLIDTDDNDKVVDTVQTDADGKYSFDVVMANEATVDNYKIKVVLPSGYLIADDKATTADSESIVGIDSLASDSYKLDITAKDVTNLNIGMAPDLSFSIGIEKNKIKVDEMTAGSIAIEDGKYLSSKVANDSIISETLNDETMPTGFDVVGLKSGETTIEVTAIDGYNRVPVTKLVDVIVETEPVTTTNNGTVPPANKASDNGEEGSANALIQKTGSADLLVVGMLSAVALLLGMTPVLRRK